MHAIEAAIVSHEAGMNQLRPSKTVFRLCVDVGVTRSPRERVHTSDSHLLLGYRQVRTSRPRYGSSAQSSSCPQSPSSRHEHARVAALQ
jgi:hypothetical protein